MLVVGLVSEVSPSLGAIFASAPTGTPLSLYISVNGKEGLERQKAFLEFTAGSMNPDTFKVLDGGEYVLDPQRLQSIVGRYLKNARKYLKNVCECQFP